MIYFAILLIIPVVTSTSHNKTYDCVCNFGKHPLAIIKENIDDSPSPKEDTLTKYEAAETTAITMKPSRFNLHPGHCIKLFSESMAAHGDFFPVSLFREVGFIENKKGVGLVHTICDVSTGIPVRKALSTILSTLHTDRPAPGVVVRPQSTTELRHHRKRITCTTPICIDCHCKFGKLTQTVLGLVGKRTVCLPCSFCSVTCPTANLTTTPTVPTVPATPLPQTTAPPTPQSGCTDAVDSCALFHSRSVCTEFADFARQNCAKYCGLCPSPETSTEAQWISFGNK